MPKGKMKNPAKVINAMETAFHRLHKSGKSLEGAEKIQARAIEQGTKEMFGSKYIGPVTKGIYEAADKSLIMEFMNPKQMMDRAMGVSTRGPRSKRKA